MKINDFIGELSRRLRDVNERQWDRSFLIKATNSAFVALCNAAPEAHTVERTLTLAEGTRQRIDDDLFRIIDILHNVNGDGSPGLPVTMADRGAMDTGAPGWRSDAPRAYVRHWLPSDLEDSGFDVWPPVPGSRRAEPTVVVEPVDPESLGPATPAEIEQYQVDLAAYQAYLVDLAAWQTEPDGPLSVQGVFTNVPEVVESVCEVVEVPTFPGQIGFGKVYDLYSATIDRGGVFNRVRFMIEHLDDSVGGPPTTIIGGDNPSLFVVRLDAINNTDDVNFLPHEWVFEKGTSTVQESLDGISLGISGLRDITNTVLRPNDSRFVVGNTLLCAWYVTTTNGFSGDNFVVLDFAHEYIAGVTQGDIDAYYAALYAKWLADATCDGSLPTAPVDDSTPRYALSLAAYNDAVAAADAYNESLTMGSPLPFNRYYLEILFNYALYYCYAIDDDMTANSARAQRHMYNALAMLNKTEETAAKVDAATVETDR